MSETPSPPNGRPAHERLILAIEGLCDQFAVCGLQEPVAILVAPGQAKVIEAMVSKSQRMLFDDKRCGELRIWGIPIREASTK